MRKAIILTLMAGITCFALASYALSDNARSNGTATKAEPGTKPKVITIADKLRFQIRVERLRNQRLQRVNRRLARAFIHGPGYISPNDSAWECIHHGEGAWNANTGNSYYGGLQMDMSFQRTYGPEFLAQYGTANNWPPAIQKLVADRAHASRGFSPWPNTARACGLI